MKKLLVLFVAAVAVMGLPAQVIDYELEGFVNENDEVIHDMNLILNQDFSPRVKVVNHGPNVAQMSDTLYFDMYVNDNFSGMMYLRGSQLQQILPGQSAIVSWPNPIYNAALMDVNFMTQFAFCFELRLVGNSVDPDLSNNRDCVQVDRPLAVEEFGEFGLKAYPNPVSDVCRVECEMWDGGLMSLNVYDIFGKEVKREVMEGGVKEMDMSGLASGIYVIKVVRDGKVVSTEKLVKK